MRVESPMCARRDGDSLRRRGRCSADRQQPARRHGRIGALDVNQLGLAEHHGGVDQPRGRLAEHDPTWRRGRFHPLRHSDLLADRGVTRCAETDFAGDHLTGVQPDPKLQVDTVTAATSAASFAVSSWISKAARQARKAWSSNATGAPNNAMMPSPVNLSTVPP